MQIWCCFLCKDMDVLMRAFITYVRPLLEYCSPVWSPSSKTLIDQLESVQQRFTKRLPGLQSITYDEHCACLKIDHLELRRLYADLILCYKIIHGLKFYLPKSCSLSQQIVLHMVTLSKCFCLNQELIVDNISMWYAL